MNSQTLFYIIICILLLQYAIDTVLDYLNARKFNDPIPSELQGIFDEEEYLKSQSYKKENYRFSLVNDTFSTLSTLLFLLFGGFNLVDNWVQTITEHSILQGLLFFGILMSAASLLSLPFGYYQTFIIEEKFGFNKTSKRTFFKDLLKNGILSLILGGVILFLIFWFLSWAGTYFWLYAWGLLVFLMLFINLFYTKLIVPIFNKQSPLEAGSLKNAIEQYAQKVGFNLDNVFVIDGSKRSTKSNAYFSGFGKQKRVTLFDTLINDLNQDEIVAVLAHEVGHYKRNHIIINMIMSILVSGFTLYILSLFVNTPELSLAIGVERASFHAALIGFTLLYSPISTITSLVLNFLSRKFEFQADDYAKETYDASPLISSLKKLSKNNLGNLTPHPLYVIMNYSHPPLAERIRNLKA